MNSILKPTIVLGGVAFLAAYILSQIQSITQPDIERQVLQAQKNALKLVLPGYSIGEAQKALVQGREFTYWIGTREVEKTSKSPQSAPAQGPLIGYAFLSESPGYSGQVRTMTGVTSEGVVLGISILHQTETPGLGGRSTEVSSSETFWDWISGPSTKRSTSRKPWFEEQFSGLKLNERVKVVKRGDWDPSLRDELLKINGISAITGATITSRAVLKNVEEGMQFLKQALGEKEGLEEGL